MALENFPVLGQRQRYVHFSDSGFASLVIAISFFALSAPQFLNFGRLVPALLALHILFFLRPPSVQISRARALIAPVLFIALVLWCALSALWSVNSTITFVQTLSTALSVLLALRLGRYSVSAVVRGIAIGAILVLALSVGAALAAPGIGLAPAGYQAGALQGPYSHRNVLAQALTLGVLSSYCLRSSTVGGRLLHALTIGSLLTGVILTRSSTAFAVAGVGALIAALLLLIRTARFPFRTLVSITVSLLLAGSILFVAVDPSVVFALLNRDDSFTGRTVIWKAVNYLISIHPWLGYGWGATWGVNSPPQLYVESVAKFLVPNAHSGYLDIILQIGTIGLVILMLAFMVSIFRALLVLAVDARHQGATWTLVVLPAVLLYDIDEPLFVTELGLFVIFLLYTCVTRGVQVFEVDRY